MDWLFDSVNFMTRNHCGIWPSWLIVINQVANFLIFVVYTTIALSLFALWLDAKRYDVIGRAFAGRTFIILMFVFFIQFCGLTHLMDVLAFSWAPYRLFTLVDFLTAIVSIPTAIVLPGVIRKVIKEAK